MLVYLTRDYIIETREINLRTNMCHLRALGLQSMCLKYGKTMFSRSRKPREDAVSEKDLIKLAAGANTTLQGGQGQGRGLRRNWAGASPNPSRGSQPPTVRCSKLLIGICRRT